MNAITPSPQLPQSSQPSGQISTVLSPGLASLLHNEQSDLKAVTAIVGSAVMLAEAKAVLPSLLEDARRPAGPEGVFRVISRRFATFPQPERDEDEFIAWWADKYDALADLPESALEGAMRHWIKTGDTGFLPTTAWLRQHALGMPNKAVKAYDRCKAAVEYEAPRQLETPYDLAPKLQKMPRGEPSSADKARVRRMFADYADKLDAQKVKAKPEKRHYGDPVETDAAGLSPTMRALMARQAENPR